MGARGGDSSSGRGTDATKVLPVLASIPLPQGPNERRSLARAIRRARHFQRKKSSNPSSVTAVNPPITPPTVEPLLFEDLADSWPFEGMSNGEDAMTPEPLLPVDSGTTDEADFVA